MKKDITKKLTFRMFENVIQRTENDLINAIEREKDAEKFKDIDIILYIEKAEVTHQIRLKLQDIKFLFDCYIEDFKK